jgi:hypothetical protein
MNSGLLKPKTMATTKRVAETGTTYVKQDTAPAYTANSFSEIKIRHVIMEIKNSTTVTERTMTLVNVFEFQRALLSIADVNYNKYNVSTMNKNLKHRWILSKYYIYLNARQGYSLKFGT